MKKIALFLFSLLFLNCSNDSESDLTDPQDTPKTYTNYVKGVIDGNCISCHGNTPTNGAPMSLTTYNDVKSAIETRGLIDRISRAQGAAGMMPNGGTRLPQTTIDNIIAWRDANFPE